MRLFQRIFLLSGFNCLVCFQLFVNCLTIDVNKWITTALLIWSFRVVIIERDLEGQLESGWSSQRVYAKEGSSQQESQHIGYTNSTHFMKPFLNQLLQVVPCPPSQKYQAACSQARLKSCWALPPCYRPCCGSQSLPGRCRLGQNDFNNFVVLIR